MKLKEILIHFILIFVLLSVMVCFFILCSFYDKVSLQREIDFNEAKITEYRMKTEQYRMERAKKYLEYEEARLDEFLEKHGKKPKK